MTERQWQRNRRKYWREKQEQEPKKTKIVALVDVTVTAKGIWV